MMHWIPKSYSLPHILTIPISTNPRSRQAGWWGVVLLGCSLLLTRLPLDLVLPVHDGVIELKHSISLELLYKVDTLRRFVFVASVPLLGTLLGSLVFMQFEKSPMLVQFLASVILSKLAYLPMIAAIPMFLGQLIIWGLERPLAGVPLAVVVVGGSGLLAHIQLTTFSSPKQRFFQKNAGFVEHFALGVVLGIYIVFLYYLHC